MFRTFLNYNILYRIIISVLSYTIEYLNSLLKMREPFPPSEKKPIYKTYLDNVQHGSLEIDIYFFIFLQV